MTDLFGVMRAPRAVLFGCGQRFALGRVAAGLGKRALVCTDKRFSASPEMAALLDNLKASDIAVQVFDDTLAELPIDCVKACVAAALPFKPDMVVGIGGGSCLDIAKLASLLLKHGGTADMYYGEFKVPGPILPVIAIATTSGTGSEVTPVAVLADEARDLKVGISSPYLIPHTAICDPELTLTCPPMLTAITGSDAMTHAIEAFTAVRHEATPDLALTRVFVGKNAFSDHHALAAIGAIAHYLPRAMANGADIEARSMLMFGAVSAGLAFGVAGTAAAHAIQYPIGAVTHTAHGIGVAALMPYVMAYNMSARVDEFAQIAHAMGETQGDAQKLADKAVERVARLFADIGIPPTIEGLGVQASQLDWISEQSMLSARLINNNPRPLKVDDISIIVANAFHGRTAAAH
jgi:alcohol dehydrogenase